MKKFTFLILAVLIFVPAVASGSSIDALALNQQGQLSVEQINGLTAAFDRRFLFIGFIALVFLLLSAPPIVGLWVTRKQKDFWFNFFLVILFVILLGVGVTTGVFAFKHYLNKKMVATGAQVSSASGILEKYIVKTGKFGEVRKFQHEINGEKYGVWPKNVLDGLSGGETVAVYYIELLDTGSLKTGAREKMIINFENF